MMAAKKKRGPGRPELPPKERRETTGAPLTWYERRALEEEAKRRGLDPVEHRRRKLLRGLWDRIEELRKADQR